MHQNPFNLEPRIQVFSREGKFRRLVSQIEAFRLLRNNEAFLLPINPPSIQFHSTKEKSKITKHSLRNNILYGNYKVQSIEGQILFNCNNRRVLWYLNRDLAEFISDDTIRLKFNHNGSGCMGDEFYLAKKFNRCVVCGTAYNLNRHHVLPKCFRNFMPWIIKSHSYHDILLMCTKCHAKYESKANELKEIIAKEFNTTVLARYDLFYNLVANNPKPIVKAHSAASTLLKYGEEIPAERRQELLDIIEEYIKRKPNARDLVDLSVPRRKKTATNTISFGQYVVSHLDSMQKIQKFTERWRMHFLEVMQPKFMPEKWDIHRPVVLEN